MLHNKIKNNKVPLFSIIMPVYNKEEYIERSLNSVFVQNEKDFELIVINDGSTDSSYEKLLEYKRKFHFTLINQSNKGVSVSRNNGINKAIGDYICFLDPDDTWNEKFLSTIKKAIKDSSPQVITTGFRIVSMEDSEHTCEYYNRMSDDHFFTFKDFLLNVKGGGIQFSTISTCIKRELFNSVGYFPVGESRGEDIDLWLRIMEREPKAFWIHNILATYYRNIVGSLTRTDLGEYREKEINRTIKNMIPTHHKIKGLLEIFNNYYEQVYLEREIGKNTAKIRYLKNYYIHKDIKFVTKYLLFALLPGIISNYLISLYRKLRK